MTQSRGVASRRVLIVEDDYFLAQDIAVSMAGAGAEIVGPVPSVEAALEVMRDGLPDIAVLDLMLDRETAYPIADILSSKGIPFVFATAYSELVRGDYRYVKLLEKPVDLAVLNATLSGLLAETAKSARGYGVQMVGDLWKWHVQHEGRIVAQGTERTSLAARIAALQHAIKLDLN